MTEPRTPDLSLVIPFYNEEACVRGVIDEASRTLTASPYAFEILAVDDGSRDGTPGALRDLAEPDARVRVITLAGNTGQSAAFAAGIRSSRAPIVVFMDGDGQNDPADIPTLVKELNEYDACLGIRTRRMDTLSKRIGSRFANAVRRMVLNDGARDTGCSLKAIRIEYARAFPLEFRGMHRFMPAFLKMQGARVKQVPVNHRPRAAGHSKYTNLKRLSETVWDLWAVRWMMHRYRTLATAAPRFPD